jgi:hypothetical protein
LMDGAAVTRQSVRSWTRKDRLQSPPCAHHARHYLFMAGIIRRDP